MNLEAGSDSNIKVYNDTPRDVGYEELGLITTKTGQIIFHDRSATGMIDKIKAEAENLGADAMIVRSVNEGTWGRQGGGNTGFDRGDGQAIAIKYRNP